MSCTRRGFAAYIAGNALAGAKGGFRAVAFDAFPILDPRPVAVLAEQLYPGRGKEFGTLWRTRQFEYTWLRTLTRQYCDFGQITENSLEFAAAALEVDLTRDKRARLMNAYLELKCWQDVPDALRTLKKRGMRLALLSNMTATMLEAGIRNSRLDDCFDHVLSTDRVRVYKPAPAAYQMGVDAFRLPREEILFAAFAGWDASGAKVFGYPTYWVNRLNQPMEELGVRPDGVGTNLQDLVDYCST